MEYLKAIEKGSSMAMLNLGSEEQGKKDVAKEWYLTAAEKGNSSAMYNLGFLYEEQGKLDLAEKWYLTAAEKEILWLDLAEKWLTATENGNSSVMNNLGFLKRFPSKNPSGFLEVFKLVNLTCF